MSRLENISRSERKVGARKATFEDLEKAGLIGTGWRDAELGPTVTLETSYLLVPPTGDRETQRLRPAEVGKIKKTDPDGEGESS
jgi:hypothetical protein